MPQSDEQIEALRRWLMSYGFKVKVEGDYACFTRPEMKVERVSYDVITPTAARGVLDAIYWKPAIRWVVDRLHVLKEIRFDSIRRNEVKSKIPVRTVEQAAAGRQVDLHLYASEPDMRQQRAALVLRDVAYVIEAHFEMTSQAGPDDTEEKHYNMALRRMQRGQCYAQPFLGCREFPARFELVDGPVPQSKLCGDTDLGWILQEVGYEPDAMPKFFRARMVNGVIDVPRHATLGVGC